MKDALTFPGWINETWPLNLTPDRVEFHAARPKWEHSRLVDCGRRIKPGMTVFDVGAECGDFTALYRSWVGPNGTVVAVEPSPPYWPAIRAHWEGNLYREPPLAFVGFASDTTSEPVPDPNNPWAFTPEDAKQLTVGDDGWPLCSVGKVQPDFGFRHLSQQTNSTPQTRLDDLAEKLGVWPDALIFDIEGAELRALQGSTRILERGEATFWVSVHPPPLLDWYGAEPYHIHEFMLSYGYRGTFLGREAEEFWRWSPEGVE